MGTKRKNKKDELIAATVRLVANGGAEAATVRAIAREAGVTDAAVYRHYRSKEDLCWRAYAGIVDQMIRDKQHLVASAAPLREKLRAWTRLTYASYDQDPAAFTFVLSTPHLAHESQYSTATGQGDLFLKMIKRARAAGEIRPILPELALSHFAGVLLNVPRLINEGTLKGPASAYTEEVAAAAWRMLRPETA